LPGTIGGGGGGGGSNSTDGPNSTPANANKPTTWRRKVVQQFKKIQGNSPNSQANAVSSFYLVQLSRSPKRQFPFFGR
jgi:hypothetical protein